MVEVGGAVHHLRPGDQVFVSSVSAGGDCGECSSSSWVRAAVSRRFTGRRFAVVRGLEGVMTGGRF